MCGNAQKVRNKMRQAEQQEEEQAAVAARTQAKADLDTRAPPMMDKPALNAKVATRRKLK